MNGSVPTDSGPSSGKHGHPGATAMKRRKRVITDARKEQNRTAQRLYRQRQKLRHQILQGRDRDDPRHQPELRPRPSPGETQENDSRLANGGSSSTLPLGPAQRHFGAAESGCSMELNLQTNDTCIGFLPVATPQVPTLEDTVPGWSLPNEANDASLLAGIVPDSDVDSRATIPYNPLSGAGRLWAFPQSPSPSSPSQTNRSPNGDTRPILSAAPLNSSQTFADTTHSQRYPESGDALPPSTSVVTPDSNVSPHLADPYVNALQHTRSRTLTAFLYNALSLDFSLRQLLGGPHTNCSLNACTSPFYRPDAIPSSNPSALLNEALSSRPGIPQHLRPTLAQILFPHHAFLDLLPFPSLRSKAITLAAAMPHAFDCMELKKDIYVHEAILCRADERGDDWSRGKGDGQPWDMRSWEVAPWFLRKWRLLLAQDDGHVRNTRESLQNTRDGDC